MDISKSINEFVKELQIQHLEYPIFLERGQEILMDWYYEESSFNPTEFFYDKKNRGFELDYFH